ncbi:FAD/NAD(P)-binding protein [Vibrio sp. JC009]|uniref:FAD/NAD(P)-binding protein n=1 Tax=Vibrio sp. JC009 TaxID=2912314 RepID=UPI0023B09AB9|nr:FAD/NAD(P)-binding protein [Vibrio sp. JC009]WED24357.1 FAD/NAD(P)-binding protein [Vibrio sp. JC009]
MNNMVPVSARVVSKTEESPDIVTLSLKLDTDRPFSFHFGQFNMLSVPGVGEVAISIMGYKEGQLLHTIRSVGRVTRVLTAMEPGQQIGVRGPFGKGWPLNEAIGKDLIFITAGLGCAPAVAAINHAIENRQNYRRIVILQGVKHHYDLLWQEQYEIWRVRHKCQVLLAASEENKDKRNWRLGVVTELINHAQFDKDSCVVMMCGPEIMMKAAIRDLAKLGVSESAYYLSLERNFQCGQGFCGHCQIGPFFVCKDGPVFHYPEIKPWFGREGF